MKKLTYAMLIVVLSAAVGHSRTKVRTDYDPETSFSDLGTYAWSQDGGEVEPEQAFLSPLLEKRIQDAVDLNLASKGLQETSADEADLLVSYHVTTRYTGYRRPYYGGYGYGGYGYGGYGYDRYGYPGYVDHYLQVTLVIDFHDVRTGELIWRSWATKDMARQPSPHDVAKYARKAVKKMFKKFPPESPKG